MKNAKVDKNQDFNCGLFLLLPHEFIFMPSVISKSVSWFLLFIMWISLMKNPFAYWLYEAKTDVFVTLFCVNQNRPQLNCNGKCYLAKLEKEQAEKDAIDALQQLQNEMVYCSPYTPNFWPMDVWTIPATTQPVVNAYANLYVYLPYTSLLKPPQELRTHLV